MPTKEEVLKVLREQGPIIPNQIKRLVGGDTVLIGAMLSEFIHNGIAKYSHLKVGSSPVYYTKGQESKLLNFKKYLNQKDQRTVDLLREHKILKDSDQEMLIRVSSREIKDFAKQIEVTIKGEKVLYWKWYLTSKEEAETLIRKELNKWDKPVKEETNSSKATEAPKPKVLSEPTVVKTEQKETRNIEQEKPKEVRVKSEPIQVKKEQTTSIQTERKPAFEQEQTRMSQEAVSSDDFSKQLHDFFNKKEVKVLEENIIRKNSEIELKLLIPSAVGNIEYFCKAKNKKKCNDGDLSSAYLKGQMTKLPVMFITTGDVTKKAKDMLMHEFKGLVLKQI